MIKSKHLKYLMFLYISACCNIASAQTGIFTYQSNNVHAPNLKTTDIIENTNGDIFLLNFCSDEKYKLHSATITEVNEEGKRILDSSIEIDNLHELIQIKNFSNSQFSVFGNSYINKSYNPFQININAKGEITFNNELPQGYSTLLNDVIADPYSFMLLYSKVGKNNLYNISCHKISKNDGDVVWLRKISSENNEEADNIVASTEGNYYILGKKYNDDVSEYIPIIYYINSNGEQLWKKALDVPSNFNSQSLLLHKNSLIYICSYTKSQTGFSETNIYKLSLNGEIIHSNNLPDFNSNGLIAINDNSYLVYGSEFIVDKKQVVTKGKYVIINRQLSDVLKKTLDQNDYPDKEMNLEFKTSSDFVCATLLNDNRIALGGKIFMPAKNSDTKQNASLLMLINKDGSY